MRKIQKQFSDILSKHGAQPRGVQLADTETVRPFINITNIASCNQNEEDLTALVYDIANSEMM